MKNFIANDNAIYYKIIINSNSKMTIVCLQWFDEYDYEERKFYKNTDGEDVIFGSQEEAIAFLNKTFKVEHIDSEFLTPNNERFLK